MTSSNLSFLFIYAGNRSARIERALIGEESTDFFFGAIELMKAGNTVECVDLLARKNQYIIRFLERIINDRNILPSRLSLTTIFQVFSILRKRKYRNYVVVGGSSGISYSLGLLKKCGFIKNSIIGIHSTAFNWYHNIIKRIIVRISMNLCMNVFFNDAEKKIAERCFRVYPNRLTVIPMGVDISFWSKKINQTKTQEYILFVGNDERKDFRMLKEIALCVSEQIIVVTGRKLEDLPKNILLIDGGMLNQKNKISDHKLRKLYQSAKALIIPLIQTVQSSGISVANQAMAAYLPVICSKTNGIWGEGKLKNRSNILFVEIGDAKAFPKAIRFLEENKKLATVIVNNAYKYVVQYSSAEAFAKKLKRLA